MDAEKARAFEMQANMLRVLANSKRLMIMDFLGNGARTVSEIASALDMTLQNTSQHLRLMKEQGIVSAQKEGQTVSYRLTNTVFKKCCEMAREALIQKIQK